MLRVKRILLPSDLSDPAPLLHALRLAQPFQAELHVFHVAHGNAVRPPSNKRAFLAWLRAEVETEEDAPPTPFPALHFHQEEVGREVIAKEIARFAAEHEIDLIIMGTHGRQGLELLLNGSISEAVVRLAPCPVLTFRLSGTAPPSTLRHLLVPTDFSDCSQHALMHARALAARYGARLTLLHVIPRRSLLHAHENPSLRQLLERMDHPEFYDEHLRSLFEGVPGPEVPVTFRAVKGTVAETIAREAREVEADLIVIATHGLSGVRHYLMGSVTARVVRLSEVPVFTVKSFARSLVPASPASFGQPAVTSYTHLLFEGRATPVPPARVKAEGLRLPDLPVRP